MSKPENYQSASDIQIYKRLLGYVVPFWPAFLLSIIGYLIYSLSNVAFIQLLSYIVDSIGGNDLLEESTSGQFLRQFTPVGESMNRTVIPIAMILIAISRGLGAFLGYYLITYVATNVVHSLRCELFDRLLNLPSSFYDKNALGHLVARVTYHVTQVTGAATDAVRTVFRDGFSVIGYLGFLMYLNWKLTLIFFLVAPVIALLVAFAGRRFRKISERIQNSMGDVTHVASEAVQGYRVVRAFGGNSYEKNRFHRVSNYNRRQTMKMAATAAVNSPVIQLLVAIALAALVWLVLDPRIVSGMTAGKVIAFISTAGLLAKPIRQLSQVNAVIQRGLAAAKEIFELFDEEIEEDQGTRVLDNARGKIEFRNVSFAYDEGGPEVLKSISVTIEPGQTVALVGRSGSGKSTLASLIPRFYEPSNGEILLDDIPIAEITLDNLREHIAVVTQQVTLFNDTISRNIAYGNLQHASEADIRIAAEKAYALEYIEDLESGFKTIVGDDGVLLSGGQRQRLAIARAFLKDAPILILDEATSALDSESEKYIQAALEEVVKNRTTFIIAHRLSTIEAADVILVIEDGRIIEQGTHQTLLASQSAYSQLYNHQVTGSEETLPTQLHQPLPNLPLVKFSDGANLPWQNWTFNPLIEGWYSGARWLYLLKPLSYVFQKIAAWRKRKLQDSARSGWRPTVPVVVVGNINVGGTGKSPLVIWLAIKLSEAGYKPGVVSRGYGGKSLEYPLHVTNHTDPIDAGDESVMIARRTGCAVVVDPDRTQAARYLLDNFDCDVILSDDGLQHYALPRDLEIAVIDGSRGLGNGLCFPAGPLREPPARLDQVDFVVVNGEMRTQSERYLHQVDIELVPEAWVNLRSQEEIPVANWPSVKQVHAVAGIGNPQRFFGLLRTMGFDVIEHGYEDHRNFLDSDLLFANQLPVIMTEKDAVRCRLMDMDLLHDNYWYLKVSVQTETDFFDQFMDRLEENYGSSIVMSHDREAEV
jgi:subfamily B ATP-binding cassette protein MsbA